MHELQYWVMRNIEPNIAKNVSVIATLAALKRGFLKKRMSSIGWSVCSSHSTNAAEQHDADDEGTGDREPTSSPWPGPR